MESAGQKLKESDLKFVREAFSEKELADMRRSFKLIDEDEDGSISKSELIKMYNLNGINPTEDEIDVLIKSADINKNGLIDFDEYLILMKQTRDDNFSSNDKDSMMKAFEVFDRDMDGFITRDEFKKALQFNNDSVTETELDDFFYEIDLDHDDRINYEEFVNSTLCKEFG